MTANQRQRRDIRLLGMVHLYGFKHREIAERLHVTRPAITRLIARATERLRQAGPSAMAGPCRA